MLCRRMESTRAFWNTPTTDEPTRQRPAATSVCSTTRWCYHHRRQRRLGEGTINGTYNEMLSSTGLADIETPRFMTDRRRQVRRGRNPPTTIRWVGRMRWSYQWTKQVASHWGGTRNGTVCTGPTELPPRGRCAGGFTSSAWRRHPGGGGCQCVIRQRRAAPHRRGSAWPIRSDDAQSAGSAQTQYFRCSETGASTTRLDRSDQAPRRRGFWLATDYVAFDDDVWEYHGTTRLGQAKDCGKCRKSCARLQRLWRRERATTMLPLDDVSGRISPDGGQAGAHQGATQVLFSNMKRLSGELCAQPQNKSHTVTAEVRLLETSAEA